MHDVDNDTDPMGMEPNLGNDPELLELHRELEGLEISERPSFGPELQAELEDTWRREAVLPMRRSVWPRWAAAMAAGLVLAFAAVPSARAAFFRMVTAVVPDPEPITEIPAAPEARFLAVPELEIDGELTTGQVSAAPRLVSVPDLDLPDEDVRFVPAPVTHAELRDRRASQATVRSFYPADLQEAGVSGVVTLELWVEETGVVSDWRIARSSGVPGLDQAAFAAAPFLRFYPAVDRGRPVGIWVRFDVEFTGAPEDATPFAAVDGPDEPDLIDLSGPVFELESPWATDSGVIPDPFPVDGAELLAEALGSSSIEDVAGLGSAAEVLAARPPDGRATVPWREEAAAALTGAISRQPDNPAPYLALGRLRGQQGLPREAEGLFDEGILRVEAASRSIPPRVVGDLHYERALIRQADWRADAVTGRIPVRAFRDERCAGVSAPRGEGGFATAGELVARNVLCPDELSAIRLVGFRPAVVGVSSDPWMEDLESSVAAFPGHVAAGIELVLGLLDEGDLEGAADRARTVETASGGAPVMTLLRGLVAYRSGEVAEGAEMMERGIAQLPADERAALESPLSAVNPGYGEGLSELAPEDREALVEREWSRSDPVLGSEVNERRAEHVARTSYARLRFGSLDVDAARVWIRFGRPHTRWAVEGGTGARTEFWDYGSGSDLVFQRSAPGVDYTLDEASRAVLEDAVGSMGYWTPSGVVLLPGQGSAFRTGPGDSREVRVALDLSPLQGSGGSSDLHVTSFLVRPSGEVLRISEFNRYGVRGALEVTQALAGDDSGSFVIEVAGSNGLLGTFRMGLPAPAEPGTPAASDLALLLPGPGVESGRLGGFRGDLDGIPTGWQMHDGNARSGHETLGLYLELYDLPVSASGTDEFEVLLRNRSGTDGGGIPVPVLRTNVSDEARLDGTWSQGYQGAARRPVFAVISLPEMETGAYELVLSVRGPGFDTPLVRTRHIRLP
jgi:TonB family protein